MHDLVVSFCCYMIVQDVRKVRRKERKEQGWRYSQVIEFTVSGELWKKLWIIEFSVKLK